MRSARKADLGLLLVTAIWGLTFPAIRTAMLEGASPLVFVGIRFLIASLLLLPFAWPALRNHGRKLIGPGLLLGVTLGGGYAMQTIGLTTTTASKSGFLTGSTVIMVPFLDRLLRGVKAPRSAFAGGLVALSGIYLLSGMRSLTELTHGGVGDLWTMGGAVSYATYMVLLQDRLVRFEHRALLVSQLLFVAFSALLLAPLTETMRLSLSPSVVGAILFCAVFATIGSGLLHQRCQGLTTPARATLIFSMEPLFAAAFSWLLLGEGLGLRAALGGALIVLAVLGTDLWPALQRSMGLDGRGESVEREPS